YSPQEGTSFRRGEIAIVEEPGVYDSDKTESKGLQHSDETLPTLSFLATFQILLIIRDFDSELNKYHGNQVQRRLLHFILFKNNPQWPIKYKPRSRTAPSILTSYKKKKKKMGANGVAVNGLTFHTSNTAEVRALFNNIKHNQLRSTTMAYTDDSLNKTTGKTTCALYLPTLGIEETYTLNNRSSIFTAEAHGILKAMEAIYHHEEIISELTVLTDSRSVLQTIETPGRERHDIINNILSTAETLKSAGTKV
ncbi:Uncharacterized protein APZ42_005239, partial [Daphnia magna]